MTRPARKARKPRRSRSFLAQVREALLAAGRRLDAELARLGLSEEALLADFRRWRKIRRGKQAGR